jgi:hypothetical protein
MWNSYLEENDIELVRIGEEVNGSQMLPGTKTSQPISEELVLRAMREVILRERIYISQLVESTNAMQRGVATFSYIFL